MPLPLAVTMGDPAGIGGELTLAAWQARRRRLAVWFPKVAPHLARGAQLCEPQPRAPAVPPAGTRVADC